MSMNINLVSAIKEINGVRDSMMLCSAALKNKDENMKFVASRSMEDMVRRLCICADMIEEAMEEMSEKEELYA